MMMVMADGGENLRNMKKKREGNRLEVHASQEMGGRLMVGGS